ncbi:MAG TPA: CpaF family protein [Acidimicrobiales bacterium]|nr:CpaF family protein [Acidimicrobiales bacterium]
MKLSEKLAALEEQERKETSTTKVRPRSDSKGTRRAKSPSTTGWATSKRKVRELVLAEVAPKMSGLNDVELMKEVRSALDRIVQREDVKVSPVERRKFVEEVFRDTLGYGPLDPLLADDAVTEVMCNNFDDIWVERDGKIEHTGAAFTDEVQYRAVIEKIVSGVGRRIDESAPMVDARLPDGSRVNAIVPPLAIHGPVLTIRKFAADPYTVKDLINFGTFTLDLATVLEACVRAKMNVLVSGGTGTGKTTNLNVLSSFIPDGERVITIEDAAELQLQQPHVINLEARPPNAEGSGEVRIRDLVRNALRMRPDRILVGEVRGGEALDMLQAMNTGHEGSMTTVHCNGPRDALSRLETMVLMAGYDLPVRAIREQIASALHLIMHLDRMPDGRRVVTSLTELQGMEGDTILLQEVFKYRNTSSRDGRPSGELAATGLRPKFVDKLNEAGIELPAKVFHAHRAAAAGDGDGRPKSTRQVRVPSARELATAERAK